MGITSAEQKYTRLWRESEKKIDQLQAENESLKEVIREAIDNCEICRGVVSASNCARCKTFRQALRGGE